MSDSESDHYQYSDSEPESDSVQIPIAMTNLQRQLPPQKLQQTM